MRIKYCVIMVFLIVSGTRAQSILESQSSRYQFVVIVRESETSNLMENFSLSVDEAGTDGRTYTEALRCSDMSIVRVLLGRGLWRFRISADGYSEEIIEGIRIPDGEVSSQSSYGWGQMASFKGTTIALPINLRKIRNGQERERVRPFLDDSTFYDQTDTPPSPAGGIEAIRARIKADVLKQKRLESLHGTSSVVVYINKTGEVVRAEMTQRLEPDVDKIIAEAVRKTRFKPAQILGTAVSSRLSLSFNFKLEPR